MCGGDPFFEHPPSTGARGARGALHPYGPLPKQLDPLHPLPISLFQLLYSGLPILCTPTPKPLGSTWSLPWCFPPEAPGRAVLPDCGVQMFLTSCPAPTVPGATACTISRLICSQACHRSEPHLESFFSWATRYRGLTVRLSSGICILQKPTVPHELCFLFASRWRYSRCFVHHIQWDVTVSILPFYS